MPDQRDIDATIDQLHAAGASDEEVTSLIREKYGKPFDVHAQNTTLRANMAKQSVAANEHALQDAAAPASNAALLDNGVQGAKGEAAGFGAGIAAPFLLLGHAVRHPVDTVDEAAMAAAALAVGAHKAAADPAGTYDAAKQAVVRFATNPTAIGAAAGALDGGLVLGGAGATRPGLVSALADTKAGQAVAAGVSDAANRIPGVKAARAVFAPLETKVPKPSAAQAKAAAEAARLAENGVVPTADAAASNSSIARATDSRPAYQTPLGRSAADAATDAAADTASRVVPVADEAGRSLYSATADAPSKRLPIVDTTAPRALTEPSLYGDAPLGAFGDAGPSVPSPQSLSDLTVVGNDGLPIGSASAARPRVRVDSNGNVIVPDGSIPAAMSGVEASLTPAERALIGNRSAGALTIDKRKALLDALLAKARAASASGDE